MNLFNGGIRRKSYLKVLMRSILPESFFSVVRIYNCAIKIVLSKHRNACLEKKLRYKTKVDVAFFVNNIAVWKTDVLFRMMLDDEKYNPYVVICPYLTGKDNSQWDLSDMMNILEFVKRKGYPYYETYDCDKKEFVNLKRYINPHIIFYPQLPARTFYEYHPENWKSALSCYVPYGLTIANLEFQQFNMTFHNVLWKAFYESHIHLKMAQMYAQNKGANVVISGYSFFDEFYKPISAYSDRWKQKDTDIKRFIWAPHHSIEENNYQLGYSNFLKYAIDFLNIAKNNIGDIQIAFKPHPLLKKKLYNFPGWGKEYTDEYYLSWQNGVNTQLEENEYVDLFMTSDAMILDSISFMAEYMQTLKPSVFTVKDCTIDTKFNLFGKEVYKHLYKAYSIADILSFIEQVKIGSDPMKREREQFIRNTLRPNAGKTSSELILSELNMYVK